MFLLVRNMAKKKNREFISNLITLNLSDKFIITHKKITTCSTQDSGQLYFLNIN